MEASSSTVETGIKIETNNYNHWLATSTVLLHALKWHLLPNVIPHVLTIRLQLLKVVITTSRASSGTRKPDTTVPVMAKLHGGKTNPPA